uniref:protein-tyrosine-phosphatase n=1 Tax=Ciona savignyi TaxID=51511 RepID=H2ZB41_CIOSA
MYLQKLNAILATTDSQLSDSVAKMPENKSKNRYANIYSYDHSRVKLQTDGNVSDYINAGYIDSYEGSRTFIASQGPKPDTVKDFWKMIWETNSKVIVMLTNLMEKNKAKCEQYWPEPGCTLRCGSFEIQLREENEKDSYITRTLLVSNGHAVTRSISQLHFTTWPDHGVPSSTTGFLRFYHHVKEVMETVSGTPVTVHCSAGVGRTGTLIGFDILMAEMKKHKSVNVLETVVNMRKDRTLMVQTLEQYIFLHKLLVEVHLFGSTDFKATEINQKIQEMSSKKKHLNGFQHEFKNLETIYPIDDSNEIASKPSNVNLNRFPGILPYDRARLILPPIHQNQPPAYYNGSMITGCPGFNGSVIAAQAPLPQHIPEFWHAVWYCDVTTIVMLTNLEDQEQVQSAQYWPMYAGQTDRHGAISVELQHESDNIKSVIQRTILISQDMTEKQVTQLHFQDWHENGPNPSADSILDLVRTLQETQTGNQGKVLVHCNDGAGRTGVLISVANLVERIKSENRIDVFRTVKDLRDMRPKMVTSEAQYQFIYKVCRKFVEGFATYDNFK